MNNARSKRSNSQQPASGPTRKDSTRDDADSKAGAADESTDRDADETTGGSDAHGRVDTNDPEAHRGNRR